MRLDFAALTRMRPSKEDKTPYKKHTKGVITKAAKMADIKSIEAALKEIGPMRVVELVTKTGISQAAVFRTLTQMTEKGDVFKPENTQFIYALTGTTVLLDEVNTKYKDTFKGRGRQYNNKSGIAGVNFSTINKVWVTTFGRGKVWRFNNLFEAACKRKSLEAKSA